MNDNDRRQYSNDLDIDLKSLDLIKENKYCVIYSADTPHGRRIVKKYKGEDSSLVKIEADALTFITNWLKMILISWIPVNLC